MNTTENNRLIAQFMGIGTQLHLVEHPKTGKYVNAKYHSSWDWLMPVVEKIERLGFETVISDKNGCFIYYQGSNSQSGLRHKKGNEDKTKIELVYEASIQFIQWYNQQK